MPHTPWSVSSSLSGHGFIEAGGFILIADQGEHARNEALVEAVEKLLVENHDRSGTSATAVVGDVACPAMIQNRSTGT